MFDTFRFLHPSQYLYDSVLRVGSKNFISPSLIQWLIKSLMHIKPDEYQMYFSLTPIKAL